MPPATAAVAPIAANARHKSAATAHSMASARLHTPGSVPSVRGGSDTHAHMVAPTAAAAMIAMMMIKRDRYMSHLDGALAVVPAP